MCTRMSIKSHNSLQITKYQSFCLQDGSKICCLPEFGKIEINSTKQTHLWAEGGTRLGAVLDSSCPHPIYWPQIPSLSPPGIPPLSPPSTGHRSHPCPPRDSCSVSPSTGHRSRPCPPTQGLPLSVSPHSGPQLRPGLGPPNLLPYEVPPQNPVH